MSRWLITASLFTALTSSAWADRAEPSEPSEPSGQSSQHRWAQPPPGAGIADLGDLEYPTIQPRALDRASVRARLVANRAANLSRFRSYQNRGVFPNNTYSASKLNVWHDEAGHLCAAATIIKASGQDDLVVQVAEQNNFIRLADVTHGPLMDWILTSGLTQAEIAAIQAPFRPVSNRPVMQPEPDDPVLVDAGMRRREDQRLLAKYRQVDARIVKDQKQSIELAVDRLMKRPDLARQLLGS
ncbi:MAG: hypothetical protein H6Q90_387 [Deltaproteobacteria bacterium]|nr:hypothetical protein [Deltaproteobacteria bacterium]